MGSTPLLNEVRVNPAGTDGPLEFIELLGQGTLPSNTWVLSVDGDVGLAGRINWARDLGGKSFGSNGLMLIKASTATCAQVPAATAVVDDTAFDSASGALQNGTESILLVHFSSAPTIVVGTTLVSALSYSTHDAVGFKNNATGQTVYGGVELTVTSSSPPDGAARRLGQNTPLDVNAWFWGNLAVDGGSLFFDIADGGVGPDFPAGGLMTPGLPNAPNAVQSVCQ